MDLNNYSRNCVVCHRKLDLESSNGNVALYRNNWYHKDCFIKDVGGFCKIKCKICKKPIVNESDCILFDEGFYHIKCFKEKCDNCTSKKSKWANAKIYIDDYKQDALTFIKEEKKSRMAEAKVDECIKAADKEIVNVCFQVAVDKLIKDMYNTPVVPWRVLDSVYKGTYKGLAEPIPASRLYDMWKRQRGNLTNIYNNNKQKGKEFTTEQRIRYDIAILVNKYPDYLRWLKKQKEISNNKKAKKNMVKEELAIKEIVSKIKKDIANGNEINISNLIDEIW